MIPEKKDRKYKWEFENIGGTLRVKISSGEDIAHLCELDPKMWTVLSCPVKGLEIDEKSLSFIDCDNDGKIRVNDIVNTSKWVTSSIRNTDLLLEGKDCIGLEEFNRNDPEGHRLYNSARKILDNLGKGGDIISLADTADIASIFAKTKFNGDGIITIASADAAEDKAAIEAALSVCGSVTDRSGQPGINAAMTEEFYKTLADYASWKDAAPEAPYGADTEKVLAAFEELDAKVKDFFMRSRLAAFTPSGAASLDVQAAQIEAISAENLDAKAADIAEFPIARITGTAAIDLDSPINPAWAAKFAIIKEIAVPKDCEAITEDIWNGIGASFGAYKSWKASKAGSAAEVLGEEKVRQLLKENRKEALMELIAQDNALKEEADSIGSVDKFLHIFRDFYRLLRNFVTFQDFYDKDAGKKAIFQCGTLMIDRRACHLCIPVYDMGKHNTMAPASGMYLIYCDCTAKDKPGTFTIAAAMTVGDVGDLFVGKNAIFYDNSGSEWDAVITKIIDNPISISQSFWSPYRRMAAAVENLINKNAADKDAKIMSEATAKINAAPASLPANGENKTPAQPFDIGKFAGIFAALGMALGMIGTALASIVKGFVSLHWWQVILAFIGIILVISGPSMVMAWMKLRRRNIAPLLNANGWAVNASSKISIMFGETLTDIAKFPKIKLKDPYAKKGIAPWKRWLISICSLVVVLVVLWLCNLFAWAKLPSPLPWFDNEEAVEVVEESVPAPVEEAAEF